MAHLIDKSALVAEIERMKANALQKKEQCRRSGLERIVHQIGAYNKILSFINTLDVKEVDLEKFTEKINTFQARYKHPEITSIKGAMAFMARMFYQYPNVARDWYESMPKATMD